MTFGEKVDAALDRGAFHRGELYNHSRAGENGNTTATLVESRAGYVHPREKMLEEGDKSFRRGSLDLLEEDMVEPFKKVVDKVPSFSLAVG